MLEIMLIELTELPLIQLHFAVLIVTQFGPRKHHSNKFPSLPSRTLCVFIYGGVDSK